MTTLTGHGKAIGFLLKLADHTYVTSDDGLTWPCWGGQSGGRKLCSATGSSKQANCLSQTDSHAGIIYGVSGVCHQTANRILYPANVTVSNAKGYWASWLTYGTYGTPNPIALAEWLIRVNFCMATNNEKLSKSVSEEDSDELTKQIISLYQSHSNSNVNPDINVLLQEEHSLVMKHKLGDQFNDVISEEVLALRKKFNADKQELDSLLEARKISSESYTEDVNLLVIKLQQEVGKVLGSNNYNTVFGSSIEEPINIIDLDIVKAVYGNETE